MRDARIYIYIYIYIHDFSYRGTALIQAVSLGVSPADVPTRLRFFRSPFSLSRFLFLLFPLPFISHFRREISAGRIISNFHLFQRRILFSIGAIAIYGSCSYACSPPPPILDYVFRSYPGSLHPRPPRRDAHRAPSYSNRSPRPTNIDSSSKNSPRCPTNIFYGRIAKNSFAPMLSPGWRALLSSPGV